MEIRHLVGGTMSKLAILSVLIYVSSFTAPALGYTLRSCRINDNVTVLCADTSLKFIPQDIPQGARQLDLSNNNLSEIRISDFKQLANLTYLNLKNNKILEIDSYSFSGLSLLNELVLNTNKIVILGDNLFYGLSNLTVLRLANNHIRTVAAFSFQPLRNLNILDLNHNNLARLNPILTHLPHLKELTIKWNRLSTFQSWELSNETLELSALDLSNNPLHIFKLTANIFPELTRLTLAKCGQKVIWDVHNKTFLNSVSKLDISGLHVSFEVMRELLGSVKESLTFLMLNSVHRNLGALINISCQLQSLVKLSLQKNSLRIVRSNTLRACSNVSELDLAFNQIQDISNDSFRYLHGLRTLSLKKNNLSAVPYATRNLPALEELILSFNKITALGCNDFANLTELQHLHLHMNSISALEGCTFKDLDKLLILRLNDNSIVHLNDAFKKYLTKLKSLNLGGNELTDLQPEDFSSLQSLQDLNLQRNNIKNLQNRCFFGLSNLMNINLQRNKLEVILSGIFSPLKRLKILNLFDNHIKYNSDEALDDPPFSHLSCLETLLIFSQHHRLKSYLPRNLLQGLMNLSTFNARNIQITSLHESTFIYTPNLNILDLSSNTLTHISADLFSPFKNLTKLYLSQTNLRSLDFLISANLSKLQFLQIRKNAFSVVSETVIKSLPNLVYLDMKYNSFTCDCDNAWFAQWTENSQQTQVFDAFNFNCNYPSGLEGMRLLELDVHYCSLDVGLTAFISTSCLIALVQIVSFTYHLLRWQLFYAYYLFLAFLFNRKQDKRAALHQYDAFVSYNIHDESWILGELLPHLEDEQGWKLCLHHRDFQPGKPIVDNIIDAIYGSRKTICVITQHYLDSEWCSREIQVASFRLFDEHKDVLILVFLEEIPSHLLSPYYRMRSLLKRQTYLSWPRAGGHQRLFWEKLRQALGSGEMRATES